MDYIAKTIGANMRKLRMAHNFSQAEVGAHLGVSFQQIQKYENGRNRISSVRLVQLKHLYDVPYERFFSGIEMRPEEENGERDWVRLSYARLQNISDPHMRRKLFEIIVILSS